MSPSSSNSKLTAIVSLGVRTVLGVGILALGVMGFLMLGKRQPPTSKPKADDRAPLVVVSKLEATDKLVLRVDGEVQAYQQATISAEVAGRVVFKAPNCETGATVADTDEMIRLEPEDYNIALEQLLAQERQAKVSLKELQQELQNAQASKALRQREIRLVDNEIGRLKELGLGAATATAIDEADRAKIRVEDSLLTLDNLISLIETRRKRLELSESLAAIAVRKATLDKSRTKIPARRNGVIVREHVEKGDFVQRGTPLFTVLDTSRAEVRCNIQMEDLYWVWDQDQTSDRPATSGGDIIPSLATVAYELPGRGDVRYTWQGQLLRYDGLEVSLESRTVPCRVLVKDPLAMKVHFQSKPKPKQSQELNDTEKPSAEQETNTSSAEVSTAMVRLPPSTGPRQLLPGMYVSVWITTKPRSPLVLVPTQGLSQPHNKIWILRRSKEEPGRGKIHLARDIHIVQQTERVDDAKRVQQFWVVDVSRSNLKAGDEIVVVPVKAATEGMEVRLSTEDQS